MNALIEVVGFIGPLICFFVLGVGMWAVGQWLRRKGYGAQLDKIDANVSRTKAITARAVSPFGGTLIGLTRGFSRIPFLGSKRSRAMWDKLDQDQSKHTK